MNRHEDWFEGADLWLVAPDEHEVRVFVSDSRAEAALKHLRNGCDPSTFDDDQAMHYVLARLRKQELRI